MKNPGLVDAAPPSGGLPFAKLHGAQNDFVFVPFAECHSFFNNRHALQEFARLVCGRRSSLGADGLIVWDVDASQRVRILIVNSDGSFAGTCGNALRCLGLWLVHLEMWNGARPLDIFKIVVPEQAEGKLDQQSETSKLPFATLLSATLCPPPNSEDVEQLSAEVCVSMGTVQNVTHTPLHNDRLSMLLASIASHTGSNIGSGTVEPKLAPEAENVFVQLANPHWVVFSTAFNGWSRAQQEAFGAALQGELRLEAQGESSTLPVANIGMLHNDGGWKLVVYERGAGLTECCGSGACAARVALETLQKVTPEEALVRFKMPGGTVSIGYQAPDLLPLTPQQSSQATSPLKQQVTPQLTLKGPAVLVAQGKMHI